VKKNLATAERRRQAIQVLTGHEREEAEWLLKYLELHEQRIKELREKIKEEAKNNEDMKRLQSIPGIGPIVAYAYVAHVGDGSRFSKGAQVSKKKTIVSIARKLSELMYSVLRNKTIYETRKWDGPKDKPVVSERQTMCAKGEGAVKRKNQNSS